MKFSILLLASALISPLSANTVYTIPQGYTKVTIAAADATGSKLTAISVSLLNENAHSGTSTIGSFVPQTDAAAFTDSGGNAVDSQGITFSSPTTWTADQWTTVPHLAYISVADDANNADGIRPAQEAFLILANDLTGGLTLAANSDISSKFPANTKVEIRQANTIGSILANPSVPFDVADRVNFWNGTEWKSVRFLGGIWRDSVTFADSSLMVVFPEEGLFIERAVQTDTVLTLFGEVPAAPQIATLTDSGFMATRHPIATDLPDLEIGNSNWNDGNGDRVYIWDAVNGVWTGYRFLGGVWRNATTFADATNLSVPGDSAVFISRGTPTTPDNGSITPTLPYNPFEPS